MRYFDLIIKDGYIVNTSGVYKGSIAIKDGKIVEITNEIINYEAKKTIDAKGLHIFPGLIDTHVHINEPGEKADWEGYETGTKSLAAGGVTTFFDMPLSSIPPTTTSKAYDIKDEYAKQKSLINYKLWGGLIPDNIEELEGLHRKGVVGFKAFMSETGIDEFPHVDDITFLKSMAEIARLDSVLAVHAESDVITKYLKEYLEANNKYSISDFCDSRPVLSEIEAVGRLISYAEVTGCKLHICHVSSGQVAKKIHEAKRKGIRITAETCPHYLSFTSDDLFKYGTILKCNPPLRDSFHNELLWESIFNGEVDTIASDHSPAPLYMKESETGNIFETWSGILGAQATLNLMVEEGYWKRKLPLERIVELTSTNPAKVFGLYPDKGKIEVGSDADFAIMNLNELYLLKEEDLFYRHRSKNPYVGKQFRGKVTHTIVLGRIVFENGRIKE